MALGGGLPYLLLPSTNVLCSSIYEINTCNILVENIPIFYKVDEIDQYINTMDILYEQTLLNRTADYSILQYEAGNLNYGIEICW